jgi:Ca-activated chloride channel family protein
MTWSAFALVGVFAVTAMGGRPELEAQAPTFQSGIDVVRISAVVRNHKGRFVQNLSLGDFEILDNGRPQPIADFRQDVAGVSVALLFDVSGSMEGNLPSARDAAADLLACLQPRDEAAVFTFDTRLDEVAPFTDGLKTLPASMSTLVPFGATSLHDAIAETARRVAERGRRSAVVVFTDGRDNTSRLTPPEVSGIASGIDVPVYIFGAVPAIDNPFTDFSTVGDHSQLSGALSDLAEWTGGHVFVASTAAARNAASRQIVDELRHQYVLAFESSGPPGWHPLVVRARAKDLTVRARSGYFAGQYRPASD